MKSKIEIERLLNGIKIALHILIDEPLDNSKVTLEHWQDCLDCVLEDSK